MTFIPFHSRKPVQSLSATELMKELTEDAIALRATPLSRFTEAVERIAVVNRVTGDAVYEQILDEKARVTGNRMMPAG